MNENRHQYRRLLRAAFVVAFISVYAFMMWKCWIGFYHTGMERPFYFWGHVIIMSAYILGSYVLSNIYGAWRIGERRLFYAIYALFLTTIMMNSIMYVGFILLTKHIESLAPVLILSAVQLCWTFVWAAVCDRLYLRAYPPLRAVLVHGSRSSHLLEKKLAEQDRSFRVAGRLPVTWEQPHEALEGLKDYDAVVIGDIPAEQRNKVLKYCYDRGFRTYLLPKLSDILIRSCETEYASDSPILLLRNEGLTAEQRLAKRGMDLILSIAAVALFSPIMLLVSLFIKLEDGGDVIYRQERLTEGGRSFHVLKFRSMREDAESDGIQRLAQEGDPRITRTGRVIRALRLDELPQLFNIIRGDMSIVGPRPERPELSREYEDIIPEFSYRLKAKAGLTGYAQVYGKYNTTAYDKLKLDLMYIQSYSLALDIEIILKTVQILFMKESTEGLREGETNAL